MYTKEIYINGNIVQAPLHNPKDKERYEELEKSKKQSQEAKKNKRIKAKLKIMRNILIIFILGFTLIKRYSVLYETQNSIDKSKTVISNINQDNESLKLQLLQSSNIKNIEEYASNKLKMVYPEKNNALYENINKNNFNFKKQSTKSSSDESIINKIKKMLF